MRKNFTKFLITLVAASAISSFSYGQYPKLVVEFTDKKNSPYSFTRPGRYLSPKAIQRRVRYNIALDSSDLPVNPSYIRGVVSQGPVTYLSQSKWLNQVLIYCIDNATIDAIRNLPFVKSVQAVGQLRGTMQYPKKDKFREEVKPLKDAKQPERSTAAAAFDYGFSYDQVHIHNGDFLHNRGFTGNGVTIAVIDAGFYHYRTTRAFDSAIAAGHILGERDFVEFDNSVNEDDSHGEYCLSTIATNLPGTMVGTAPHASFWLLRGENTASELPIEEHNWVAAAEFADSAGCDMISSSLGYFRFDNSTFDYSYDDFYKNTTMVSKGATYAARKGMIVTNSAGNEGISSWKYLLFPADDDSVCAVAATTTSGDIAYFSSFGYPGKIKPNIASVGSGTVVYTSFGISTASGTSFSNPNINGLIACLWQAFPKFNNMTILNAVYQSSDRYNNPDNRFGFGIPDMRKAYAILRQLQNRELYGDEWLFAKQDASTQEIHVTVVGRIDGNATLKLLDEKGIVLSTINMRTESQEVYERSLATVMNCDKYTVQYDDGVTSKSIDVRIIMPVASNN